MRAAPITAAAMALLLAAPAAGAAPTCDNRNGDTVKCGTPGAMPVGWTPPREVMLARPDTGLSLPDSVALIYILVAFFTILALMPDFEEWGDSDWDEQEGDRGKRR